MSEKEVSILVQAAFSGSKYRRGAEMAGFTFGEPRVLRSEAVDRAMVVTGSFTCVCGRSEYYNFLLDAFEIENLKLVPEEYFDPGARLYAFGAFSLDHLLADGYSEEDAERIARTVSDVVRGVSVLPWRVVPAPSRSVEL
jgi:hypothetical protein